MSKADDGADKRRELRESFFNKNFPGFLIPSDDELTKIQVRPVDVSPRGFGFFSNQRLVPGSFFWLMLGNHKIRVELAYCNPHLGIPNLYRCGLFIREQEGDLSIICRDMGLLKHADK